MASEWEAMGLDLGMGVRQHNTAMPPPPSMSHLYGGGPGDLPFFPPGGEAPPPASSAGSFNLSFADDFSIPTMQSEEAAELEWLSNFIDDSSYPDMPNYPPEVAAAAQQMNNNKPAASVATTGARTKRSRAAAWLLPSSSSSSSQQQQQISSSSSGGKKQPPAVVDEEVRRCTHCASEKTPQWRTGPLGPKTLCNACGVRYKSGRLVPEYRPAASPTFVLTQHSNSHRKVMELRRQKEQQLLHLHHAASSGSSSFRDYGVC